jgi:hypothetical protein
MLSTDERLKVTFTAILEHNLSYYMQASSKPWKSDILYMQCGFVLAVDLLIRLPRGLVKNC